MSFNSFLQCKTKPWSCLSLKHNMHDYSTCEKQKHDNAAPARELASSEMRFFFLINIIKKYIKNILFKQTFIYEGCHPWVDHSQTVSRNTLVITSVRRLNICYFHCSWFWYADSWVWQVERFRILDPWYHRGWGPCGNTIKRTIVSTRHRSVPRILGYSWKSWWRASR